MTSSPSSGSFPQACNLLSKFLEEKSSFPFAAADLSLSVDAQLGTTVAVDDSAAAARRTTTMNLFPEHAGVLGVGSHEEPTAPAATGRPMTIFYDGQAIVLNDLTLEKAKEIMDLAIRGSTTTAPSKIPNLARNNINMMSSKPTVKFHASNLPIARNVSLHRFLEKRKDRISGRGPYVVNKEPQQLQSRTLQRQGGFASASAAAAGVPELIHLKEKNKSSSSSSSSWLGLGSAGYQLLQL